MIGNETINAINSSNPVDLIIAANNDSNTLLLSGILILIWSILLFALSKQYNFKNGLLASSLVLTFLSGIFLILDAVKNYFLGFFLIITIAALIYRVVAGD